MNIDSIMYSHKFRVSPLNITDDISKVFAESVRNFSFDGVAKEFHMEVTQSEK